MVSYHLGQLCLPAAPRQPFTLALIPDGAIPCDGIIRELKYERDPATSCWVVRWIREVFH